MATNNVTVKVTLADKPDEVLYQEDSQDVYQAKVKLRYQIPSPKIEEIKFGKSEVEGFQIEMIDNQAAEKTVVKK